MTKLHISTKPFKSKEVLISNNKVYKIILTQTLNNSNDLSIINTPVMKPNDHSGLFMLITASGWRKKMGIKKFHPTLNLHLFLTECKSYTLCKMNQ